MSCSFEDARRQDEEADGESWTRRSESIQTDLIKLFERGDYHDSCFEVFSEKTADKKVYKCHKAILAASSCVFAKMLHGQFKEAHLGPDDPIPLHKVTPEVFESAMRFVYGQDTNFQNVELAKEVYKFAHEMLIPSLMLAVTEFFKTVGPNDALAALDFCIQYENERGVKICKELLQKRQNSSAALKSEAWLTVSDAAVLEVLQMDQLDVAESEVLEALLKWGRARVAADSHDPSDGTKLRKKIDSSLKLIRWTQFDCSQFLQLCQGDLGVALCGETSFQIINCVLKNKLPEQLSSACLKPRIRQNFSLELNLSQEGTEIILKGNVSRFIVKVDKDCCFVGLKFIPVAHSARVNNQMQPSSMYVHEKNNVQNQVAGKCCKSNPYHSLILDKDFKFEKDVWYNINLRFPQIEYEEKPSILYKQHKSVSNEQLTVDFDSRILGVNVKELIFRMLD